MPCYARELGQNHDKCGGFRVIVSQAWQIRRENKALLAVLQGLNAPLTLSWQAPAMMPRSIAPLLVAVLLGCGAQPAPEFFGAKRSEVSRDGRSNVVFHTDKRVEVVRLGYAPRWTHQAIRATMIDLIPEVTGCKLVDSTLQGDSGEMRGSIRC
jgi:hypothetical protein